MVVDHTVVVDLEEDQVVVQVVVVLQLVVVDWLVLPLVDQVVVQVVLVDPDVLQVVVHVEVQVVVHVVVVD